MPKNQHNYNVYLSTSTFGAHMNNLSRGFTAESVIFLLDTFLNWVCPSNHDVNPLKNEDLIHAHMEQLVDNAYARKLTRKAPYRYSLTELGLIELTRRVVDNSYLYSRVEFFFVYSYLENYSPRTFSMMKNKGSYFPYQTRLEIESLLDIKYFIEKQFDICLREISSLKERIDLAGEIKRLVDPLLEKNKSSDEIIHAVEEVYPYALHSMLEISHFLKEFTTKQVVWELSEGIVRRSKQLWSYELEKLELHVQQLKKLKTQINKAKK